DLVTANMIRDIRIEGSAVAFRLVLTSNACPLKEELETNAREAVAAIPGVTEVTVETQAEVPESKGKLPDKEPIPLVKNTIAVASGKGGVGKSTVAVNLAVSLAKSGAKVGLMDSDLYGPSIPLMMGIHKPLDVTEEEKLIPLKNYGVKLISVGFMLDEETPLIWRGPLVMQLVTQFLTGVNWGKLDYLIIDLPPGTGDAQLTLVQTIPVSGVVIVTTPQDVALIDARRAIKMFKEVQVPVLGIVENMSYFKCPSCAETTDIFSSGGAEKTSERYDVPLLGKIPLNKAVMQAGEEGKPTAEAAPDSEEGRAFKDIAGKVASRLGVLALS
ncbi:MAG: Mrp/NBP35 family ATP-binding protein, partial [Thermodesulfobacteriota bacterium]